MQKSFNVFYGWYVVAISALGLSTGIAPFLFASLGLFMLPLHDEFGWNRAEISAVIPVLIVSIMITQPFAGRLIDKIGARKILIPSTIAFGLLIAAIPIFMSEIWHLAAIFFLIGTLGVAANNLPYMRIVSNWFNKKRGLAIGASVSGIGLGYAYTPILVQSIIDAQGWRAAYYVLSLLVLFITLPLITFFLKESPESMGMLADGEKISESNNKPQSKLGFSSSVIIRKKEFWILLGIFLLISFNLHGLLPHLVPMLSDRGFDTSTAALVASSLGITVFISRILIGYLLDIFFAPYVAAFFFALSALGFALFAFTTTPALMFLAAILAGLSLGAEMDILAYLIGKYFGLRSFGEVYGLLFVGIFIGSAFGPPAFGLWFENTGSYSGVLILAIAFNIATVLLTMKLSPYPGPNEFDETTTV